MSLITGVGEAASKWQGDQRAGANTSLKWSNQNDKEEFADVNTYEPFFFDSSTCVTYQSPEHSRVKEILRGMSIGFETYATANYGAYPESEAELVNAVPPFVKESYCGKTIEGYFFACEFSKSGYEVKAIPRGSQEGVVIYKIKTGDCLRKESVTAGSNSSDK